jgi:hypothetical protein
VDEDRIAVEGSLEVSLEGSLGGSLEVISIVRGTAE